MTTISTPKNPQNYRVYAPATSKKRNIAPGWLLRTRTTFTKSVMVSVGVSKLGRTHNVWGTMQDHVYRAKVRDVDNLIQRLVDVWDSLEQSKVV